MNASEARALSLASVPAQRERAIRDISKEIERASRHGVQSVHLFLFKGSNFSKDSKVIHHVPLDQESQRHYEEYLEISGFEFELSEDRNNSYQLYISWEEE